MISWKVFIMIHCKNTHRGGGDSRCKDLNSTNVIIFCFCYRGSRVCPTSSMKAYHILHITSSKETKIYKRNNPQSNPGLVWSFYTFQMTLNVNNVKERPQKQHHGRHWTNCPCITLLQRCRWTLVEESQFLDVAGNCWYINIDCHQFKEMLFKKRNICPTPGG